MYLSAVLLAVLLGYSLALERLLSGAHVRIGYLEIWPSMYTDHIGGRTTINGPLALLVEWAAKRANFTYELIQLDYTNKFAGLPWEFETKKLNWAVTNWALSHGRNYLADILFPYNYEEYAIIIPFPKREPNIQAAILPYSGEVWACILSAMTAAILSLVWLARKKRWLYRSKRTDPFVSYHSSSMYVVGVATNQGASCSSKARSTRLVAGVWCFAAVVLVNAYSSCLITYMTIPSISPVVRNIEDLANRSDPQILTRADSFIRVLFETSAVYRPYWENAAKRPNKFCGSTLGQLEKCVNLVKDGGHVMAVDDTLGPLLVHRAFTQTGSCQVSLAEGRYAPGYSGTILPLNSPHQLRNRIDTVTLEAISYGLVDEWKRRFRPRNNPCINYKSASTNVKSLTLKDLTSGFVVLGIGVTCSCFAFLFERLLVTVNKKAK